MTKRTKIALGAILGGLGGAAIGSVIGFFLLLSFLIMGAGLGVPSSVGDLVVVLAFLAALLLGPPLILAVLGATLGGLIGYSWVRWGLLAPIVIVACLGVLLCGPIVYYFSPFGF